MLIGPGLFSNGMVEIANPDVLDYDKWNYIWAPGYSIQPGAYSAYAFDSEKKVSDQVTFSVMKGAVTIVASGEQSYYLGEKIKLSGTCTTGSSVFLSIISLPSNVQRKIDQISIETINNDENTFLKLDIKNDSTWEYVWDTSKIASLMNEGTYTIIACEGPFSKDYNEDKAYGTISIILKKPFLRALISNVVDVFTPKSVGATVSQSSVAQGDSVYITGIASGKPQPGIQIWVFGKTIHLQKIVPVNDDGSFSLKLDRKDTKNFSPGEYFVIVQHPMMNNEFDLYPDANGEAVLSNDPKRGIELFSLTGPEGKHGVEAAKALIQAINSKNIDDIYTKLQFQIDEPEIQLDPISDKHFGDKFIITARTNLAVDDEVLFQVYSPKVDQKLPHGEFHGVTGTAKVWKGDSGSNKLVFNIDISILPPGEYIVTANAINQDATDTNLFNII